MRRFGFAVAGVLALAAAPAFADGYHYQPGLHSDPFQARVAARPAPVDTDVLAMRVSAVVTGRSVPVAMLEDDKGQSFIVREGQSIGRHRVAAIRSDRVVLIDVLQTDSGPVKVTHELKVN